MTDSCSNSIKSLVIGRPYQLWPLGVCAQVAFAIFIVTASEGVAESFPTTLRMESRVSRSDGELGELVANLSTAHDVTIQIDPRVNPRTVVETPKVAMPLLNLLDYLANYAAATARPLGETILITPIADADRIATLAAIRQQELVGNALSRQALARLRPFDLKAQPAPVSPEELLSQLETRNRSATKFSERPTLKHDLWNVDLKQVTLAEALAFVLVPMDRSFEWTDDGFRLTDLPSTMSLIRKHRLPTGRTSAEAISLVASLGPAVAAGRTIDVSEKSIQFRGTALEHERFANLLQPAVRSSAATMQKRYTLLVEEKPAGAVLRSLKAQGLPVDFDRAALIGAGIDLEKLISIDVNQVTAEGLIKDIALQLRAEVLEEGGVYTIHDVPN